MTNRTSEFLHSVSELGNAPPSTDFKLLEHMGHLFDVTQDLLCVLGFDDQIRYLNGSWENVLGYLRAELISGSLLECIHPADRAATIADIEKVQAGIPTKSFSNRMRCKNGTYKWISWSATASTAQQCIYASGRDITEHRRSEEYLLRLAQALEHSSEMICMCDTMGRAVYASHALLEASGYEEREILGKPVAETLLASASPASLPEEIHRALIGEGKWSGDCLQRCKNSNDLPVFLSIGLIKDRAGLVTGSYCISQDVAERRRSERVFGERTAFLDSLVENCPLGIVAIDVDHSVKLCNPAFEKIFGYREQDIVGRPLYELLTTPSIRAEVDTNRLRFAERKPTHTVTKRARSDGSLVDVEAYSVPLGNPGNPTGALVLYQDITARKRIEQQLRQAQKMEAVGQLAGGIAHDFNNLLMVILGYAAALTESPDIGQNAQSKTKEISKAANRAASLTRQLLAFSRQQVLEPKVMSLNLVVEDVKKMLGRLINEDIALVTELDPGLGCMKADHGQIEQVLVNLAVNARDAMPKGGKLTIKTGNIEVSQHYSQSHEPMPPGSYIGLTVSDSGLGMDARTQSRVFEPFFTTKEQGKGTGLGLATVYGVVKQSGGFIWLTSEVGRGTTFEIFFPRVSELIEDVPSERSRVLPARGSEKILLVEDDEALRALILSSLRDAGYTVLEAANGVDGLRIAHREAGTIELVVTDVVMPGMSGPKMAEQISDLYPKTRILYMSGYFEFGGGHQEILRQGRTLLQKPFELRHLERQVREILESPWVLEVGRS